TRALIDPEAFGISPRRLTISTCGVVTGIDQLAGEGLPINLAVSLHAPDDPTRARIMPINRKWGVEEVLAAAARYVKRTKRRVTFEYVLLAGVNDSEETARELAALITRHGPTKDAHVNLIPYNPGAGGFRRPPVERMERFAARSRRPSLGQLGLAATASILLALFVQAHVDPSSALWLSVTAAYVLGFPPFAFASWIVVRNLRERPGKAGTLYAADLAGAGTGSVLAFLGLPLLGAPGLYGLAALLAALAAATSFSGRSRVLPVVACIGLTAALAGWGDLLAPPQVGPDKSAVYGAGIEHLATRWDPYARVDVVQYPEEPSEERYRYLVDPAYTKPRPDAHVIYLDLGAATPILDGSGDMNVLRETIIAAPY